MKWDEDGSGGIEVGEEFDGFLSDLGAYVGERMAKD